MKIKKGRKELTKQMQSLQKGAAGFEKMTTEFIQAASSQIHMMSISVQTLIETLIEKGVLTEEDMQRNSKKIMEARIKEMEEVEAMNNGTYSVNVKKEDGTVEEKKMPVEGHPLSDTIAAKHPLQEQPVAEFAKVAEAVKAHTQELTA